MLKIYVLLFIAVVAMVGGLVYDAWETYVIDEENNTPHRRY